MKQLSVFIFIVISFSSFAQLINVGNEKDVLKAKDKTLLVRLYEKGDVDLNEFADDEKVVKNQNQMLKDVFTSSWKLNEKILFVTADEMSQKLKENSDKYAVVNRSWGKDYKSTTQGSGFGGYGGSARKAIEIFEIYYGLPKGKKGDKYDILFSMAFPDDALGEFDFRFFASQANEYVNAIADDIKLKDDKIWDPKKNISEIQKGTLYVLENSFKGDLSDAKSKYCGELKGVTADQLYSKIKDEPDNSYFITAVWSYKKKHHLYVLVDAKTYDMKGLIGGGGVQFEVAPAASTSQENLNPDNVVYSIPLWGNIGLKAKHFNIPCKAGAQKINY